MNKLHAFQPPIFQSDNKCNDVSAQICQIPPSTASRKPRAAAGEASRRDRHRRNAVIHTHADGQGGEKRISGAAYRQLSLSAPRL